MWRGLCWHFFLTLPYRYSPSALCCSLRYVNNIFIPLSLTFLLAYSVAAAFLHVYDLTIATMLLCFCEDYKYHSVDELSKTADHDEVGDRVCAGKTLTLPSPIGPIAGVLFF